MPKRIQYRVGDPRPEGAVIITGNSRWNNPFPVNKYGQTEAVRLHREQLLAEKLFSRAGRRISIDTVRRELRGFDLACTCGPDEPCHGDVLLAIANPSTEASDRA